MTLSTEPFRLLVDEQQDHLAPATALNYNWPPKPDAREIATSDRATAAELALTARNFAFDITLLRETIVQLGETWPPRAVWLEGFRAAREVFFPVLPESST